MIKKLLTGAALALGLTTSAWADNALVIGNYTNSPDSVASRLEAAGHTVTIQRDVNNPPADISGYDQIWDLRWYDAFDQTVTDQYDDFVKNGGFLFISTENPGCCNGQNATKAALITQMGGGDTTIGGVAGSTQDVVVDGTNTTYMTDSLTVNFSAISAIVNNQGTALITDGNGAVAAMMWVGNAGDLGTGYTGTVITIADINWLAQGFSNELQVEDNTQALDDIIGGVVAGTVAGTISEEGNGEGSDIGGGTTEPTVTGTEAGDPIVVVTTADGGTATTIATVHGVSETDVEQTVETTVTTTLTTATNTTTCTTTTTITNYSDGSASDPVSNDDESCATATTYASTSSATVDTVSGRIDQMSSVQDITTTNIRGLEFNGAQGIASAHKYDNGLEGTTRGFSIGGKTDPNEEGFVIGGGIAQMSTSVDDADNNSASASTTALQGSIAKGAVELSVTHAMNDYSITRHIGDWTNSASTSGTDTSASIMFRPELEAENVHPVIGYTRGKRTVDAYTEGGDALTARSVAESSEMYGYGTVGATVEIGLVDITGVRHTDGVNQASIGIGNKTEKFDWNVGVNRTMTDLGNTNSISAGLAIRF
jgi:hypothetical protein